jgi:hypothetical protein
VGFKQWILPAAACKLFLSVVLLVLEQKVPCITSHLMAAAWGRHKQTALQLLLPFCSG